MGTKNLFEQLVSNPHDIEQFRNLHRAACRYIVLTQDVNYNLQEIADDTKYIKDPWLI
jgi:hypothetical protein